MPDGDTRGPWKIVEFYRLNQTDQPGWYWRASYRDIDDEITGGPFKTAAEAEADAEKFKSKLVA